MPTNPPTITALPSPPDPNDRSSFNVRAYPWSVAQQTLATEVAAVAVNVKGNADQAVASAVAALASEASAAASAASAVNAPGTNATSTTSLVLSAGPKIWFIPAGKLFSPGQPVVLASAANPANQMTGLLLSHNSMTGECMGNMIPADGVVGTHADWVMSIGVAAPATSQPAKITRESRSTNVALVAGDNGKIIGITAAITQNIAPGSTLPAGWNVELRNEMAGDFVVDPSYSELIDNASLLTVKAGWAYQVIWDGTKFTTKVTKRRVYGDIALITANTSITIGPDTYVFRAYAVGKGANSASGYRAAGAGMAYGDLPVKPSDTVTFAVASNVATVAVNGTVLLTANPASSTLVAGTASLHASVVNGGAYAGGPGASGVAGGSSSGSPLGVGVMSNSTGGAGWGGTANSSSGGGTGGTSEYSTGPGKSISFDFKSAEPLLALLDAPKATLITSGSMSGNDGGPGAGGSYGSSTYGYSGGKGGIGGGGGSGYYGGGSVFGGGGAVGGDGEAGGSGGLGGYGGGGGSSYAGSPLGQGGAAAFLYFRGDMA